MSWPVHDVGKNNVRYRKSASRQWTGRVCPICRQLDKRVLHKGDGLVVEQSGIWAARLETGRYDGVYHSSMESFSHARLALMILNLKELREAASTDVEEVIIAN